MHYIGLSNHVALVLKMKTDVITYEVALTLVVILFGGDYCF